MKIVVITGTNRGLGKALFDLLIETGACIVSISRKFLPYQVSLAKKRDKKILLVKIDLSAPIDSKFINNCFSGFSKGSLEEIIYINNAGTIDPIGEIGKLKAREIIDAVFVNLISPIILTNEIFRRFLSSKARIKILNISSGAALRPIAGWSLYCASKSAAAMFFDTLKGQCIRRRRVSIVTIDPGVMNTDMQKKIRRASKAQFPMKSYFVNLKRKNKLAEPKKIANTILKNYISL